MLHGLFGDGANLSGLARRLGERFDCHLLDLPNHGSSPWLPSPGVEAMAEEVFRYLDASFSRPVAVLGHSLGGKVAMQLADRHPERLSALVVLDIAPVRYPPRHEAVFEALGRCEGQPIASRAALADALRAALGNPELSGFLARSGLPGEAGLRWRFDLHGLEALYPDLCGMPESRGAVSVPLLLVAGAESDYVAPEHEAAFRRRFNRLMVRIMAGAGHWLHADKPDVVAALVSRFLASVAA